MLSFSLTGEFNTLEAVNLALVYMREPRIDDLALINTSFSAETAYAGLLQQNRVIQSRGWWFNCGKRSLSPLTSGVNTGRIQLPSDWVKIELPLEERGAFCGKPLSFDIDSSGNKWLVNPQDNSYIWGRSVCLERTTIIPYDQTPDVFRQYVAFMNASLCGQQVDEGIALTPFHQRSFETAEAELMSQHLRNDPVNNFSTIRQEF